MASMIPHELISIFLSQAMTLPDSLPSPLGFKLQQLKARKSQLQLRERQRTIPRSIDVLKMAENIRSKDQAFYLKLDERPPTRGCRELLQEYSGIAEEEQEGHLEKVRDMAWSHHPYPSIGLFVFLDLGLSGDDLPPTGPSSPADPSALQTTFTAYQTILTKLRTGGKFLDVGCMFAQDCRKLIFDGAPPSSIYGTDLHAAYFSYGYALFKDEDKFPRDHFIACDTLDPNAPGLKELEGKLDVINATHVIHVFSYDEQIAFLTRLVTLLKPEKGTMITGRLSGHDRAGYHKASNAKATTKSGGDIWEHNAESFTEMMERVGRETGTRWDVGAWLWKFGTHSKMEEREGWFRGEGHGIVTFVATRV